MDEVVETPFASNAPRTLRIQFTGSGSEYFRIWIVNLLLIVVTLGFYLPFAKARRIRYFYANTQVDGQALSFHGDPWKMFRGFILLVLLMGAYGLAGRLSPLAGLIAFLALCAVWPALWRASMQFRLGNTSWRGLRMSFEGSLAGAYRAVAPLYVPLIAFIGLSLLSQQGPAAEAEADTAANPMTGILLLLPLAVAALATPWFLALTKRYQHNGYRIATQHAQVSLPTRRLYLLSLKSFGMALLPTCLGGAVLAIIFVAIRASNASTGQGAPAWAAPAAVLGMMLMYLLWFVVVGPFFTARMQDMVWGGTRSQAISFVSRLRFRALFWLTLKNWLLVALTLGLYRPFAAIHTARLRLEAVALNVTEDPSMWQAQARTGMQDATGEVAGDFFGIDMGL